MPGPQSRSHLGRGRAQRSDVRTRDRCGLDARRAQRVPAGAEQRVRAESRDELRDHPVPRQQLRAFVAADIEVDGADQSRNRLLVGLHAPTDPVIREAEGGAPRDEVGASQDQPGRLRAADLLAPAHDHEVGPAVEEAVEVRPGRELCGGVDHERHARALQHAGDVAEGERAGSLLRLGQVQHQSGSRGQGGPEVVGAGRGPGADLDDARPADRDGLVVPAPVGAQDHALVADRRRIAVRSGYPARRRGDREPGGGARRDAGRLHAEQARDLLACTAVQQVQVHERQGGLAHRLDDLRRHQRPADRGHRPPRVDQRGDTQLVVDPHAPVLSLPTASRARAAAGCARTRGPSLASVPARRCG